jgi:hypothetical protein
MNLNNLSKEELINHLKKYMVKCINTFTIEGIRTENKRDRFIFTKGEYYFFNISEGGMCILSDSGEWFDVDEPLYKDIFDRNFIECKSEVGV